MAVPVPHEHNGNGHAARRWERYTLSLLSAILGLLSILFWDMKNELMQVRRVQDQRTGLVNQVEKMVSEHGQIQIRLAVIDKQLMVFDARLDVQSRRVLSINRRLDTIPGLARTPEPETGY